MRPLFRIKPKLPARAFKTFATSWRNVEVRCNDPRAACDAWRHGWRTVLDVSTPDGRKRANYVRLHSGRAFSVSVVGTIVTLTFPAGQQCFATHRVKEDAAEFYVVGGDWRGNPNGQRRRVLRGDQWVDDFATHQQRLHDAIERG